MRWRYVATEFLVLLASLTTPANADTIAFYTDQTTFEASTGAAPLSIPSSGYFAVGCGTPTPGPTGEGTVIHIPFGSNQVTVTNPAGLSGGLCIFDNGVLIPDNNTVPALMTANTIVGDGEDDYLLALDQPVGAVGFRLLTNNVANETVTLYDNLNNIIAVSNIDAFTAPNTRQFIGFASAVPIGSLLIDTQGGAHQNEGFDQLEVVASVPEPGSLLLVGTGLLVGLRRLRKVGP